MAYKIVRGVRYLKKKRIYDRLYEEQKRKQYILSDIIREKRSYCLYITNHFGGGTAVFNEQYAEKFENLIFLQPISYMKDLYFKVSDYHTKEYRLLKPDELESIFTYRFQLIVMNSLVNNNHCYTVLRRMIRYKKEHKACKLICNIHDYHPVCPQKNLMASNRYCKLECENHNCSFYQPAEFTYPVKSIDEWREEWKGFLELCNEIICFSESSRAILVQAYGDWISGRIKVRPHDWIESPFTRIEKVDTWPMKIGIIGSCNSVPKGRLLIKDILKQRDPDIPFVLIGTKWNPVIGFSRNVRILGPYDRCDLQKIIERECIPIILFTSIWPETYSFVISEAMQMGLTILSLDIGAQGERVGRYEKGYVCESGEEVLDTLQRIKKEYKRQ